MRFFFDWEFHEDGAVILPISLGMVSEDGRELYIELQFDEAVINPWVRENVLPHLSWDPKDRYTREQTRDALLAFVGDLPEGQKHEFWAYFADYDWVCLAQLFGPMVDLPKHFPMFCMDIKQEHVRYPHVAKPKKPANAHNALADAKWNLGFWRLLNACGA